MKIEPVICVIGCFSLSLLTCIQNTFQYLSSDSITGELRAFPVSKREGDSQPRMCYGKKSISSPGDACVKCCDDIQPWVTCRREEGQDWAAGHVSAGELSLSPPSPVQDRPPLSSSHSHLLTSHILLSNLSLRQHMNTIHPGVLSTQPLPHARTERERERERELSDLSQWGSGKAGRGTGEDRQLCSAHPPGRTVSGGQWRQPVR